MALGAHFRPPPKKICGGSKGPPPCQVKFSPALGLMFRSVLPGVRTALIFRNTLFASLVPRGKYFWYVRVQKSSLYLDVLLPGVLPVPVPVCFTCFT